LNNNEFIRYNYTTINIKSQAFIVYNIRKRLGELKMTVLERILQLRNERKWTEYRLSEESGIAQTTISSWFKKDVCPSISSLESLCRAFNITMSQFFAYENVPVVLTDKQRDLLDNWNRLSKSQQDKFLDLLKSM